MKIITEEACTGYHLPGHPERPARIARTLELLRVQKELPLTWAKPGSVTEEMLLRAHDPEHLKRLKVEMDFDADTPFFPGIEEHARASAAAAVEAMRCARTGETVFSLMRPPGHHATQTQAMGFCYLNNAAIAVLEALATGTRRVAVYDFDVHHGNGTEAILVNQAGTEFFSIHESPCYPGTGMRDVGDNCRNYPVLPHTPREEYRKVLEAALKKLQAFKPELVAVCAGFDCSAHDPLAQQRLETEDFYWLGESIRKLGVPAFTLLEGGYGEDLPQLIFAYLKGVEGK